MSKRGVGAEEKRQRTIEFFHESKSFFTLKDLVKLVTKAKGIVSQSVEDIVKGLVDDGIVHTEKVGTVNLYWSFPSESSMIISNAVKALRSESEKLKQTGAELESAIDKASADRLASAEREDNLKEIQVLNQDIADMKAQLKKFSNCDPVVLEERRKLCNLFKSGAEIWTENLSMVMSHCRNEYQIDRKSFCAQFELPDDFEELCEEGDDDR